MAIKLNARAYEHARQLIKNDRFVVDGRDDWSEHRPSARQENAFIERHGIDEYAKWYLGVDDEEPADRKSRYRFPYGDFERAHRCGILAAESRAAQNDYQDIRVALAHLHGMVEGRQPGAGAP